MIDKEYFMKRLIDTNKLCGFYIDDYTAELLYDRFHIQETEVYDKILEDCLEHGEKVVYKVLKEGFRRNNKQTRESKSETPTIIEECEKESCEGCDPKIICLKMNSHMNKVLAKLMGGVVKYAEVQEELNKKYPGIGFDKKHGTVTGVIFDENGKYHSIYEY